LTRVDARPGVILRPLPPPRPATLVDPPIASDDYYFYCFVWTETYGC